MPEKRNIIFDVDVSGGLNLKKYFGNNALSVFIDVPNLETLKNRLLVRGSENYKSLKERIEKSKSEIKMRDKFDLIIMNDRMSRAKKEILTIVKNFIKK